MNISIINQKPFCLYKGKEVGIATGYFAGDKFAETDGDEFITEVSGRSFGWTDNQGIGYKSDKSAFTRPSVDRIIEELMNYPSLMKVASDLGLIKTK